MGKLKLNQISILFINAIFTELDPIHEYEHRQLDTTWSAQLEKASQESIRFETTPVKLIESSTGVWQHTNQIITDRIRNMQNVQSAHLSSVLHLASLSEIVTSESVKQHEILIDANVRKLKDAINAEDALVVHEALIACIEEISTWLEKIEYRVYLIRQNSSEGPSEEKVEEHGHLLEELKQISSIMTVLSDQLHEAGAVSEPLEQTQMQTCFENLNKQVSAVFNVTKESDIELHNDLSRMKEFVKMTDGINFNISELQTQFDVIQADEDTPINNRLEKLDELECGIMIQMDDITNAFQIQRGLIRDFPSHSVTVDVHSSYENVRQFQNAIVIERNRLIQLKDLAEEYAQTLNEFAQIIILTESIVDQPISASSFEELQQEMQKHRKCFVNLSHCRMILQSLGENIDSESRMKYKNLYTSLQEKSSQILEKASDRAQRISLAASRWTVLEKGLVDEKQWLHVARQRVPDLSEVSTVDYDRYITMYKSISSDIHQHHARIVHLTNLAARLQDSISAPKLQEEANDCLAELLKLREELVMYLNRLTLFRENWTTYESLTDRLEQWMLQSERELSQIMLPNDEHRYHIENTRQFWEIRVHYEVSNKTRKQIGNALERSIEICPIRDELLQRQFHQQLEERWENITKKIEFIQNSIVSNLFDQDIPIQEKLIILRDELNELQLLATSEKTIIKNEDELNVYLERMEVLNNRSGIVFNELGRLSLLPVHDPEQIGEIFDLAHRISIPIAKEIENAQHLKHLLISIQNGIKKLHRSQQNNEIILDSCESKENLGSDEIELAITDAEHLTSELSIQWQENMRLRQMLHTLPMRLSYVSVSPVKLERNLTQLQDNHHEQESRNSHILSALKNRLALWRKFEQQLETVQQSSNENKFLIDLLKINGHMDYERLKRTTERLEVNIFHFEYHVLIIMVKQVNFLKHYISLLLQRNVRLGVKKIF